MEADDVDATRADEVTGSPDMQTTVPEDVKQESASDGDADDKRTLPKRSARKISSKTASNSTLNGNGSATEGKRSTSTRSTRGSAAAAQQQTRRRTSQQESPVRPRFKRNLSKRGQSSQLEDVDTSTVGEDSEDDGGITRCVCRRTDDMDGDFMIQCEICKAWQHGMCVGLPDQSSCPETYCCERCKPEMHPMGFLLKDKQSSQKPVSKSSSSGGTKRRSNSSAQLEKMERSQSATSHKDRSSRSASVETKPNIAPKSPTLKSSHSRTSSRTGGVPSAAMLKESSRRRSTMNSRDASYEQELALALRLSKAEAGIADESSPAPDQGHSEIEEEDDGGDSDVEDKRHHADQDDVEMEDAAHANKPARGFKKALKRKAPLPENKGKRGGWNKKRKVVNEPTVDEEEEGSVVLEGENQNEDEADVPSKKKHQVQTETVPDGNLGDIVQKSETDPNGDPERRRSNSAAAEARHRKNLNEEDSDVPTTPQLGDNAGGESEPDYIPPAPAVKRRGGRVRKGEDTGRGRGRNRTGGNLPRSRISPHKRPPIDRSNRTFPSRVGQASEPSVSHERIEDLKWALPEHLSHLSHLLPSNKPQPLSVPSFSHDAAHSSNAASPSASTSSNSSNLDQRTLEAPTKIRYPARRMSVPEMKKRTRNMLDYLARIQVEMVDRSSRNSQVRAASASRTSSAATSPTSLLSPTPLSSHTAALRAVRLDAEAPPVPEVLDQSSIALMDNLSRDLVKFQEKFFIPGRSGLSTLVE